jgi:hypothetical protein
MAIVSNWPPAALGLVLSQGEIGWISSCFPKSSTNDAGSVLMQLGYSKVVKGIHWWE